MFMITIFSNEFYQLGDGTTENRGDDSNEMGNNLSAVDLGTGFVPIDIEAGTNHVCAVTEMKAVKCWGQYIISLSLYDLLFCIMLSLRFNLQDLTNTDSSVLAVDGRSSSETLYRL